MRIASCLAALGIALVAGLALSQESRSEGDASSAERTRSGLLALYEFRSSKGPVVKDTAGVGQPIDLRIEDEQAVRRSEGALEVRGKTVIRSEQPAGRLFDAIRRTRELTIEAWVEPGNTKQDGPARIVTLSRNPTQRNFTLGQEGDRYDVRLRTTRTSNNGLPSLSSKSKSLREKLTHVVYTRDRSGRTRVYLDGKLNAEGEAAGDVSNWDGGFRLALANELSGDRPWQGTFRLVAIYDRDLLPREIEQNFRAGPGADTPPALARDDDRYFTTKVAPLLARHCIECHNPGTQKGGLDLSRKVAALEGGESGKALAAGEPAESLLWQYVESDEMPKDRKPLSKSEKQTLQEWIAAGANWSLDVIDPAVFARGEGVPQYWVQRLTVPEYVETVRSLFGVDVSKEARELLPRDLRADGFSNTAYNLNIDLGHVEAYARLAAIVVERADVEEFAERFTRRKRLTDKEMRSLIERMGEHVLRGPLSEREIVAFRGISTTVASAGGDWEEAVRYVLQAMLQSPRFLYRIEDQSGDGRPRPVGEYELASRLSYIVWGGPPDAELLKLADDGKLSRQVREQAERMLRDPRAVRQSRRFVHEWLNLDRLDDLSPNPEHFPGWKPALADDMRQETLDFFEELAWKQERPLAELFDARFTMLTPELAEHYGLKPKGKGPTKYDLSDVPGRGGLLTHGSVLTVGGDEASMVSRGLFVLRDVLRGTVSDPPPCVDTTPVPTKPGLSQRKIAERRIANNACGGCHEKFEPLAFGFERFDGLGTYRVRDEHGNELRQDGEIQIPGTQKAVSYETTEELLEVLAESPRVRETITWKLAQFALGRPIVPADLPALESIQKRADENGGTYRALMTALLTSDLVLETRTESEP